MATTHRTARRRAFVRAATAGVLIALPGVAAAPAEASARHVADPVGTWSGVVTWEGGQQETVLSFFADGTLCLVPEPDPAGGAEGRGTWTRGTGARFSFRATERFFGPGGETQGWLTTRQAAVQAGPRFKSRGEATQYDPEWTPLFTIESRLTMRRTSTVPTPC